MYTTAELIAQMLELAEWTNANIYEVPIHRRQKKSKNGGIKMSENKKPRICEVLGVEVGEIFTADWWSGEYFIDECGRLVSKTPASTIPISMLVDIINGECKIRRNHRWTADDIADAKAVRRMYPDAVEVERISVDGVIIVLEDNDRCCAEISENTFPSLAGYEAVKIDEILEAVK